MAERRKTDSAGEPDSASSPPANREAHQRADQTESRPIPPHRLGTGPGRLLLLVYVIFVIAATGRSAVQIAADFGKAPLAYLLSALAACFYIAACYALIRDRRVLTRATCSLELTGVVAVGTLSYVNRSLFPDSTIWSGYGQGYGYLPLLLPVAGLAWLRHTGRTTAAPQSNVRG